MPNNAYTASTNQGVTMGTWTTGYTVTPTDMTNYANDLIAFAQSKVAVVKNIGTVTAANLTIALADGPVQTLTAGAATQLTFTGWGPTNTLSDVMLEIFQGAAFPLTFAAAISWVGPGGVITKNTAGSVIPSAVTTLQASNSSPDFIYLWSMDGGTTIFGKVMR